MAICKRCKYNDQSHQPEMPSKRVIFENGKQKILCEGFQSDIPDISTLHEPRIEVPKIEVPKIEVPNIQTTVHH